MSSAPRLKGLGAHTSPHMPPLRPPSPPSCLSSALPAAADASASASAGHTHGHTPAPAARVAALARVPRVSRNSIRNTATAKKHATPHKPSARHPASPQLTRGAQLAEHVDEDLGVAARAEGVARLHLHLRSDATPAIKHVVSCTHKAYGPHTHACERRPVLLGRCCQRKALPRPQEPSCHKRCRRPPSAQVEHAARYTVARPSLRQPICHFN